MRPAAALLVLCLAAAGGASAQVSDAPRPKRRAIPTAPPAPAPAVRSTPVPAPVGRLTLGGLAGLRPTDDRGASCRSSCARSRYACEVQEESCATTWTACLKSCSDLQTPALTTLLPR